MVENLFMGTAGAYGPVDAVRAWTEEKRDYDYNANHGHGRATTRRLSGAAQLQSAVDRL
ncbi:MAG: hypothetical protein K6E31_04830 [bacterium]|nr:hypothetical protein [bacterium]